MAWVFEGARGINTAVFHDRAYRYYREIHERAFQVVLKVDLLQVLSHDKPVRYLDLAVNPCLHSIRRDHMKFEILRNLPPVFAGCVDAEFWTPRPLDKIFTDALHFQEMRFKKCELILCTTGKGWFYNYVKIFCERFDSLDAIRKKTSICGLLKAYRLLQVKDFSLTLHLHLIRESMSPEPDLDKTIDLLRTLCTNYERTSAAYLSRLEPLEEVVRSAKILPFDFKGLMEGRGEVRPHYKPV